MASINEVAQQINTRQSLRDRLCCAVEMIDSQNDRPQQPEKELFYSVPLLIFWIYLLGVHLLRFLMQVRKRFLSPLISRFSDVDLSVGFHSDR